MANRFNNSKIVEREFENYKMNSLLNLTKKAIHKYSIENEEITTWAAHLESLPRNLLFELWQDAVLLHYQKSGSPVPEKCYSNTNGMNLSSDKLIELYLDSFKEKTRWKTVYSCFMISKY